MGNDRRQQKQLADLCDSIDYGFTTSAKEEPVGPKFLRITDIVGGGIDWSSVPFCEIEPAKKDNYRLHPGDVVIARTGATTGHSAYVSDVPDAIFASYLVRLKIREPHSARFVAYYLKGSQFWNYMYGVLGDKSAQPNASATTLTQAPIDVPPPHAQQRIADVLGTLDDKIELNRRMNRTLEKMAAAIFKSWFIDFDPVHAKAEGRDPNLPAEIADLFPDTFKDSDLGPVPKGWTPGKLGDVIEILDSKRIPLSSAERAKRKGPYPYYGAAGILDHVDDFLFSGTHVLMGEDGSVVTNDDKPVVQYVWNLFWVNNHAHVLRGKNGFTEEQLYLFLKELNIRPFVTGAVQPKINQRNMKSVPMGVPPKAVSEAFGRIVGPLFQKLRADADQTQTLSRLRDTLLPKFLSGEIELPEAEAIAEETCL